MRPRSVKDEIATALISLAPLLNDYMSLVSDQINMFCPQAVLSCKPDGDSRLLELKRHSQSLMEQPDVEEMVKQQFHLTVEDSEEQWRKILQSAEENMKKAEVQYSLSRELEAFKNQADTTICWVKELQQQAKSKGSGVQGTKAQIEDRLSTAQVQQKMRFFKKMYLVVIIIP